MRQYLVFKETSSTNKNALNTNIILGKIGNSINKNMASLSTLKKQVKNFLVDPAYKILDNQLRIHINPAEIRYHGYPHPLYYKRYNKYIPQFYKSFTKTRIPFLIPKDYQPELTLFSDFRTYRLINNIWEHDFEYSETSEYREMTKQIKKGETIKIKERVIQTIPGLNAYFMEYVKLVKSMKNDGYKDHLTRDDILVWIGPGANSSRIPNREDTAWLLPG